MNIMLNTKELKTQMLMKKMQTSYQCASADLDQKVLKVNAQVNLTDNKNYVKDLIITLNETKTKKTPYSM